MVKEEIIYLNGRYLLWNKLEFENKLIYAHTNVNNYNYN